jgi:hypothetical protein
MGSVGIEGEIAREISRLMDDNRGLIPLIEGHAHQAITTGLLDHAQPSRAERVNHAAPQRAVTGGGQPLGAVEGV